jgi:hypothetical protein
MPYSMCPVCRQMSHLSVGDVKEWYESYYPQIPFGTMVPGKCFSCWPELKPGDAVVIRKVFADGPNTQEGEIGVIKDVFTSEHGQLYVVLMDAGKECYFIRAQLRKLREGEIRPNVVAD